MGPFEGLKPQSSLASLQGELKFLLAQGKGPKLSMLVVLLALLMPQTYSLLVLLLDGLVTLVHFSFFDLSLTTSYCIENFYSRDLG